MSLTTFESIARQLLRQVAPRMSLEQGPYAELLIIRGIQPTQLPPVDPRGSPALFTTDIIRELIQALRLLCEPLHEQQGESLLEFTVVEQADGRYSLLARADAPGRLAIPLRELLGIDLSCHGRGPSAR